MQLKLISVLILVVVISIGANVTQCSSNLKLKEEKEQVIDYSNASSQKREEWFKNKLGEETIKVEALTLSNRTYKALLKDSEDQRIAWVKKLQGVKGSGKNVESATTLTLEVDPTRFTISPGLGLIDSTGWLWYSASDSTLALSGPDNFTTDLVGRFPPPGIDTTKIKIPVQIAVFWQRRRVLGLRIGKKVYEANATLGDSIAGVRIVQLEHIRVLKK